MAAELRSIVRRYSFYMSFVWRQYLYGGTCQFISILAVPEFLHEQHVCTALHYCQYRSLVVVSHDGVHLEVPEPFPVGFCRTLVYAHPVLYYHSLSNRSVTVFQAVPAMLVEAAPVLVLVLPDDGIDGFMRYLASLSCKVTGNLLRRPLVPFQQIYGYVTDKRLDGTVARHLMFTFLSLPLRIVPPVHTTCAGIASQLTGNCRITHFDSLGYLFSRTLPL